MIKLIQLLLLLMALPAWSQTLEFAPAEKLSYAIMSNDVDQVGSILSRDPGLLNVVDGKNNGTPLMVAMSTKASDPMLDAIFSVKFDVNQKTQLGTPLQSALNVGFMNGAKRLIQAGANTNLAFGSSTPPLHIAIASAYRGDKQAPTFVKMLVEAGADVNQPNKAGEPPLYTAVGLSFQDDAAAATIVKILLKAGAEPNPKFTVEGRAVTLKAVMRNAKSSKTKTALGF
jgi:ankyrin repeat protein